MSFSCVSLLKSFSVGHGCIVTIATITGLCLDKGGLYVDDVWKRCSGTCHAGGIFTGVII